MAPKETPADDEELAVLLGLSTAPGAAAAATAAALAAEARRAAAAALGAARGAPLDDLAVGAGPRDSGGFGAPNGMQRIKIDTKVGVKRW